MDKVANESVETLKIHEKFKKLSYNMIKQEINGKIERHEYHTDLRCIIPYFYKKDINSETKIYGASGTIHLGNNGNFYVYPAREFPTGKINLYGEIKYAYNESSMPLLYSVDNLNLGYQFALSAGGLINMVNPFEKMEYIYNLKNDEN